MLSDCVVVFPAGGTSRRYGRGDKLAEILNGLPVFLHSVKNFGTVVPYGNMVIPAHPSHLEKYSELLKKYLPEASEISLIPGGETRTGSISNALVFLRKSGKAFRMAAVHDAARPLADAHLLMRCFEACKMYGAAIAAHRIVNTLKKIGEDGLLGSEGADRSKFWSVETPQVFEYGKLQESTMRACAEGRSFTDDAAAVEYYTGVRAFPVENKSENLKITLPENLVLAEFLLRRR